MKHTFFIAAVFISLCMLNSVNAQNKQEFTVTNQSGFTVTNVSISLHDANNWSNNLVTTTKRVLNTEQFDFKYVIDPNNCFYDVKFTTEEGQDHYMKNLKLCKGKELTLVIPMRNQK